MRLWPLVLVAVGGTAVAQPTPVPTPAPAPSAPVAPNAPSAPIEVGTAPTKWVDWDITGQLVPDESAETVKGLLADTMATHRALTQSAEDDIAAALDAIGYHLVRIDTPPVEGGVRAILVLDLKPMVRSVAVNVRDTIWFDSQLEDEVKRRLRIRPGAYLPYDASTRKQALDEELARIADYLHDEGYFEGHATINLERADPPGLRAKVILTLGQGYNTGRITVQGLGPQSPVSADEVRAVFLHEGRLCLFHHCVIGARFTRTQHLADIAELTKIFRSRGFHSVKVTTDYDPATSFDRRDQTVRFTVHIAERRQTDIVFKGNSPDLFPESDLRAQLTFDEAGSVDDYEIEASAAAIQKYYQSKGRFDAQVTYKRESSQVVDHVSFFIEEGPARELRGVTFAAVDGDGTLAISESELADAVALRDTSPTADALGDDAERIRRLYVQDGYADARVAVRVGPDADHLGSPAVLGAVLAEGSAASGLYVHFDIEQGPRTLLDTVEVAYVGAHRGTCAAVLEQLADNIDPALRDRARTSADGCRVDLGGRGVPTRPADLETARARLKDWFWSLGRPRAEAQLVVKAAGGDPHHSIATFTVTEHSDVRIRKVIVRGNFRTKTSVILDVLGFREGHRLTGELYAAGPRHLRAMNQFSAVNVELLGFEESDRDQVDVLVRVVERNDVFAQVDLEAGYTQVNGDYFRATTTLPNQLHRGISTSFAFTFPLHWIPPVLFVLPADAKFESIELDLKVPHWVIPDVPLDSDLQGFVRQQDTPRFGQLFTLGGTAAFSRNWQLPRTDLHPARSLSAAFRFDFRLREHDQDAIRAIGFGSDTTQVPVQTRTGSFGLTFIYDRRLDPRGNLNPLIPDHGFKLEAGGLFATPYLFGQDTFFKINTSAQVIHTVNDRLQLHLDAKLDEGFPLGGAVLLPEVERFFAGGDTTVRGYAEDRLATELIETGVPPFGGVRQIRVLPAGGNIRVLVSVDAQLAVWRLFGIPVATAVFCDAGLITNDWRAASLSDIRPALGVSLFRMLSPLGAISIDYAVPLAPRLGDDPLGSWALSVALR